MKFNHFNTVVDKCLEDLESAQENGVISYDEVYKMASKDVDGKNEKDCIDKYLKKLALKHMDNENVDIEGLNINKLTSTEIRILKSARDIFAYNVVEELKGRFVKK